MKPFAFVVGLIRCALGVAAILGVAAVVLSFGLESIGRLVSANSASEVRAGAESAEAPASAEAATEPSDADVQSSEIPVGDRQDARFNQTAKKANLTSPLAAQARFEAPASTHASIKKLK
jgi:hypothetical protein